MDGLNPYPDGGWDALPNRCLDPDFGYDPEYDTDIDYDLLADEGLV